MTAIRSFPDAPLARQGTSRLGAQLRSWAAGAWQALHRVGQLRAAWELEALAGRRDLSDPALARQLRAAARECRRAAEHALTRVERNRA